MVIIRLILGFVIAVVCASGQVSSLSCVATAVPALVRAEGLAEPTGDIVLNCSRGTPFGTVTADLTVFLTVNVTNRLVAGILSGVIFTVDAGSGPMSTGATVRQFASNSVVFNGMTFTLGATGTAILRISNLRAAATMAADRPIQALLAANGPSAITIDNSPLTVAVAQLSLLAGHSTAFVCRLSLLPAEINFTTLLGSGARFATARVTEGLASAFQRRGPNDDAGTRIVARYSKFPPGARLFVPDAVAGSSATVRTSAGDLGLPAAGGVYTPGGNGSLLLVRVRGHDANGAGGLPVMPLPVVPTTLNAVGEVDLTSGAGLAVFEVMDGDPSIRESAQIPTWLGLPQVLDVTPVTALQEISLGPISTVAEAANLPVPRFVAVTPLPDCTFLQDCATNFPRLRVEIQEPFEFTAPAGSAHQIRYLFIFNDGGGVLEWVARVQYRSGADWIRVDPPAGRAGARVDVLPEKLQPGVYEATLTIDAGPIGGSRAYAVKLTVATAAPPPAPSLPEIRGISHGASFAPNVGVPGSLVAIAGLRLSGRDVQVTFDAVPGRIQYQGDTQLNVEVPPQLGARSSAQVVVRVDGRSSVAFSLPLALVAPAIFPGAVYNQDNTPNSPGAPAPTGSILQVFAAGLPSSGRITAKIHDREIDLPQYAGPMPGVPGVQQVNFGVPEDLPTMVTEALLCGAHSERPAVRVCSAPVLVSIRRPD